MKKLAKNLFYCYINVIIFIYYTISFLKLFCTIVYPFYIENKMIIVTLTIINLETDFTNFEQIQMQANVCSIEYSIFCFSNLIWFIWILTYFSFWNDLKSLKGFSLIFILIKILYNQSQKFCKLICSKEWDNNEGINYWWGFI